MITHLDRAAQKLLVFGKNGQIGRALQEVLAHRPRTTFVGRAECDLTQPEQIEQTLAQYQPQIIINASAYTAVDQAEKEPAIAHAINGVAPGLMAAHIAKIPRGVFVHYSTDYVFDGFQATPYEETDTPKPLGQYGKSKLAGEQATQAAFLEGYAPEASYYLLRTSWVYGDGSNFVKTMLKLAREREHLKVIADQQGVPSSAQWLASIAEQLLATAAPSGIYHAVPTGYTSWHALACFAIRVARDCGMSIKVLPQNIAAILATEYPLPAPRPQNSCLNHHKLKNILGCEQMPLWQEQVEEYVKKMTYNSGNAS